MVVQIISQYYHPDNLLVNDIAEGLARRGHDVRVLTGLPDYSSSKVPPEYRRFRNRREIVNGVNVRRVPIIARRRGVLLRAINYASFALTASAYALFSGRPDCDAILVSQPSPVFQALPAIIYKRRTKKKLALYCFDLWPESMKAWGVGEGNPVFALVRGISGWIYRSCDVVAVTSKPFRKYLTEVCGVEDKRIAYLPQYAEDTYAEQAGQYEDDGRVDFLFAGNVGAVQNLDCVLRASERVKTEKPFRVHVVGDGSELAALKRLATDLGLEERVVFHGRRPREAMPAFYRMADVFLLTLRGGDFIGMTLPGKAQGYLCAGKPILAAIDGAGREMMEEADCGEAVPAGDAAALAEKMRLMIENFGAYKGKGLNGRRFYEAHYTGERFFDSLLAILEGQPGGLA